MAYITYSGSGRRAVMLEVVCKSCRTPILVRRGIAQNLRLDKTNDYDILVLEMQNPDGQLSKHETPMCRRCADHFRVTEPDATALAALYAEDMEQHYETTVLAGYQPDDVRAMVARFSSRIPLRALSERARGETYI